MFAWCPVDMPGIPRELAEHELKIFPNAKPVKQSMRRYNPEKAQSMGEEINRLLEVKFIREIKEATWLSPPVMVEKKDTKIYMMCIDFMALNKHYPKDYFPLPRIDQIIDSTAGCERLSFLDAYSGYNQIRLKVKDEDKTAFITPHGVYCYVTLPFGLKNVRATYQRCMQACLKEQIGRKIEVYVDDIVIKSTKADSLLDDLRETFAFDRYNIKLNPKKYSFGVPTGQLLATSSPREVSRATRRRSKPKIQAIINMQPPKTLRHVQQLTGHLAALSRFISKLGEKALPFYHLLRKTDKFTWTEEAQAAFEDLKRRLSTSPVLVTPCEKEPMLLYIAATNQVVSSALVVECAEDCKEHGVQRPVYCLSEVLYPTKQRYPHYQKLAYAIYMTGKKLQHYFECHSIIVVASTLVSIILNNLDATGRVSLWEITLGPWEITYQRQSAIKSQVLPDFITK
jgi:hypothetical protein